MVAGAADVAAETAFPVTWLIWSALDEPHADLSQSNV
jgi:hypothetical protein